MKQIRRSVWYPHWIGSILLGFAAAGGAVADDSVASTSEGDQSLTEQDAAWREHGWNLMQRFCLDCHNRDYQEAELDLSDFATVEGLMTQGNGMTAQRVLDMIRFGAMPPDDAPLPTDEERGLLADHLDRAIYSVSCDLRPKPGKVTARRLNRSEYNHAIRDLFGMDLRPADAFPSDEVGGGFDNNGDVLSLSSMQLEKYFDAAESVAAKVLIDPETLPHLHVDGSGDRISVVGDHQTETFFGRHIQGDGMVWFEFESPAAGQYNLRLQGGMSRKEDGEGHFGVFDGDGVLLSKSTLGYFGGGGDSQSDSQRIHLTAGPHRLIVAPIPPDAMPTAQIGQYRLAQLDRLTAEVIDLGRRSLGQGLKITRHVDVDRYPYMIRKIVVDGPDEFDQQVYPPTQSQIVIKQPQKRRGRYRGVTEAASACLKPLMRRAFRCEIDDAEVVPYAELVKQATDRDLSYHVGLQHAITAILVSPRFLFRVESPGDEAQFTHTADAADDTASDTNVVKLSPTQFASRLSFFLWSSIPDEALLRNALANRLDDDQAIRDEVTRMLGDPKSQSLATEFAAQWLGLRNLAVAEPDEATFAGFDRDLMPLMAKETESLFQHIVRENRPVAELLTADYTFVNEPLATFYGISGVSGDDFRQVSLAETSRRGVLSHASVLTLTSNPTRTSPVKRGKWILENILGTPPPEPPPGVPELDSSATAAAGATLRQQLEVHRTDPSCAACHKVMDQLGFGLEQFDAVGRFREFDGGLPIDASGELPGGRSFTGARQLSEVLGRSERAAFAATVTRRLMTFALGRELTPDDRCVVDAIVAACEANDYRFQDIVQEIVLSHPLRNYEWSLPATLTSVTPAPSPNDER